MRRESELIGQSSHALLQQKQQEAEPFCGGIDITPPLSWREHEQWRLRATEIESGATDASKTATTEELATETKVGRAGCLHSGQMWQDAESAEVRNFIWAVT